MVTLPSKWTAFTLAALVALIMALSVGACGSSHGGATASDASSADATLDAEGGIALLPYPPGPYGYALGDVLPDFFVMGYAMSPTQRDSTKLPFRPIKLSEVRSTPGCSCVVISWLAVGLNCQSCSTVDQLLGAAVSSDPSVCAMEIVGFNLDAAAGGSSQVSQFDTPRTPTRADLDQWTQAGREGFPVGIDTGSSAATLTTPMFTFAPQNMVVRARDARLVGVLTGLDQTGFAAHARALCDAPQPGVETLASGLRPIDLALAGGALYVTDGERGLLKLSPDLPGAAPIVLDPRGMIASPIATDTTNVYYAPISAPGTFALAAVPLAGGPPLDLATASSRVTALVADDVRVYFTRADGVVGSVPKGGGSVTVLAVDSSLAPTIAIDAGYVYYVSTATQMIAAVPKNGGELVIVTQGTDPTGKTDTFSPSFIRIDPAARYPLIAAGELTVSHRAYLTGFGRVGGQVNPGGAGFLGEPGTFPPGKVQGLGVDTLGNVLFTSRLEKSEEYGLGTIYTTGQGATLLPGMATQLGSGLALHIITPGGYWASAITGDAHYAYFVNRFKSVVVVPNVAPGDGTVNRIRWQ